MYGKIIFILILLAADVFCQDLKTILESDPVEDMADEIEQFIKDKHVTCDNYSAHCAERALEASKKINPNANREQLAKMKEACENLFRPIVCSDD